MASDFDTAESQEHIILQCQEARNHRSNLLSRYNDVNLVVKLSEDVAVKFGIGVTAAEAESQRFAYENLDRKVVCVPRVVQFFTRPSSQLWTTGYLVMELVEGTVLDDLPPVDALKLVNRVLQIVDHIRSVKGGLRPGPVDGSHARGLLWSEGGSGQEFGSLMELQAYIDTRLDRVKSEVKINITDMNLALCHLDIAARNLIVGRDGAIYLIDWGCSGFYPSIFESWAIQLEAHISGHPVIHMVALELENRCSQVDRAQIQALNRVYAANQTIAL